MSNLKDIQFDPQRFREARGNMTLAEVAKAIGVTPQCLSNYENSVTGPSASALVRLILFYKRPAEFFTTASEEFLQKISIGS